MTANLVCALREPQGVYRRTFRHCPICRQRRRFLVTWMGVWYGERLTCVGCGDSWVDGDLTPRPFQRAWRDQERTTARQRWATAMTPAAYEQRIRSDIEAEVGGAA